jgi:hypothetical protein
MSLHVWAVRFAVAGTLFLASAVGAGWKWG